MCACLYLDRLTGKAQHTGNGIRMAWLGRVSGGLQLDLPFVWAAVRLGLPVSMHGALLTPHPRCLARSVVLPHMVGEDLCVCIVSALDVRQVCMQFNFGGCLGRMDLQDFQCAGTEERCLWIHNSTPLYPSKFCIVWMMWA